MKQAKTLFTIIEFLLALFSIVFSLIINRGNSVILTVNSGVFLFFIMNLAMNMIFYGINKKYFNLYRFNSNSILIHLIQILFCGFYLGLEAINNSIHNQNTLLEKYSQLYQRLNRTSSMKDAILDLSHSLMNIRSQQELFDLILKKVIASITAAEKGSLLIMRSDGYLEIVASVGYCHEELKQIRFKLEDTFLWNYSKEGINKPCIIRNVAQFNHERISSEKYFTLQKANGLDIETTLSAPIMLDDKLYGMLNVDSCDKNAFDQEDIGLIEYFIQQIQNSIQTYQLLEETLYLSKHDSLTKLYNRDYFEKFMNQFLRNAVVNNRIVSLIVFDLDDLKYINDTYGHSFGDHFIESFAYFLKNEFRGPDIIARYGGDEFVGIFPHMERLQLLERINKIMKKMKDNPIPIHNNFIPIHFSYGIATFPQDTKDINELFHLADCRMYQYKKNKKSKMNNEKRENCL